MYVQPLHDFVVVQPFEQSTESSSGLTINIMSQTVPDRGVVLAVGPGRHQDGVFVPTTVKVGDHVLFSPNSGAYTKLGDDVDKVLILVEGNIIGVIKTP
jgi:chaperonin GroES